MDRNTLSWCWYRSVFSRSFYKKQSRTTSNLDDVHSFQLKAPWWTSPSWRTLIRAHGLTGSADAGGDGNRRCMCLVLIMTNAWKQRKRGTRLTQHSLFAIWLPKQLGKPFRSSSSSLHAALWGLADWTYLKCSNKKVIRNLCLQFQLCRPFYWHRMSSALFNVPK